MAGEFGLHVDDLMDSKNKKGNGAPLPEPDVTSAPAPGAGVQRTIVEDEGLFQPERFGADMRLGLGVADAVFPVVEDAPDARAYDLGRDPSIINLNDEIARIAKEAPVRAAEGNIMLSNALRDAMASTRQTFNR